jgi:hypothetical protein
MVLARRRWTAEDASLVIETAKRSGSTLGAFATRHGLDPQRLWRWSRRGAAPEAPAVAFEEVRVHDLHPVPGRDAGVELLLGSGHVLRLRTAFDESTLQRLLAVLGRPC